MNYCTLVDVVAAAYDLINTVGYVIKNDFRDNEVDIL